MVSQLRSFASEVTRVAREVGTEGKLGGGCQVPIGAFAEMKDGKLQLTAIVARPDGTKVLREQQSGSDPVALGERVGDTLLRRGATRILEDVYGEAAVVAQQP